MLLIECSASLSQVAQIIVGTVYVCRQQNLSKPEAANLFHRNVDSEVTNGKDAQQGCVVAARVVSDLELCLKACAFAYPVFDALCLILRLVKGMLAMEDHSLVLLVEPRNQ